MGRSTCVHYLKALYPVETLMLKELSFKFAILLLLVTGQRGQTTLTVHMSHLRYMTTGKDSYTFIIADHLTQSKPRMPNPLVKVVSYEDASICVDTTMRKYRKRTSSLRSNQSQLLISYTKPYKGISRDTLSRWVRHTMDQAGIDVSKCSPHSTRAASVLAASTASVNLDAILKTAG